MSDPRQTTEPQDPRVKAALAEYMERVDRGEPVDRQQFLAQHADIAAELESFIATAEQLGEMAGLKPVQATLPPPPEASTRSIAAQGEETLIPKRVTGDAKATLILGLPERFGRYRVLKPLGSGAMGTVYLAEDTQLERKVALKTPSFEEDESGELLQRFYREAKAAATLRNPHICPVYDVGEIGGKHYISMAYIQGRPLSAYIQPDKPQAERQILIIIRKLALALDEAHRHGIIHRDLKPGNVMIDEKGEPIVMDFGLARRTQREEASRLTQSGMIVGSPAYMSPEQVEGDSQKIGAAADQYSLGVILYELLTGQLPFRGGVTAVIGAILTKEPTPVAELRKGVDPRVAALCARMMKKNAAERFPSLKAVADEVTGLLKDAGAAAGKEVARENVKASRANGGPAKPQATREAKTEKGAAAAAAVSITASNVTSLFEAAQKCMRKYDYEQVVQMLQQIPEPKRTDEVRALLTKARQLADEVSFLLAEIDEAERVNDNAVLTRATDELLKLKPKHHKALQIKDELSRYSKGKLWKPGGYTPDGRRIGEGSWIPWLGIAVGVITFALTTWAVTIYLKAGDAVVRVQINDPDVKVSFQGRTLNIQNANKEFKVEPGENTLKITYGDSEFETEKFTLNDGENPAVVVELLDKTLAAKFGEESIGKWDVGPTTPESITGETTTPGSVSSAQSADDGDWTWSDPIHIGPTIDTRDAGEATVALKTDELTIIIGRSGPEAEGYSDLWTASRPTPDAPFGATVKLANVNSESPEGSPAFSGDGLTLYFDAWRRSGGRGEWDLWYAQRTSTGEEFGTPRNFGAPVNSAASEAGAKVTADGLLLFFHSDRPGSPGAMSIWMSSRSSTQEPFGEPAPLGPNVNSAGRNMDPAISADGNVLIFTSDRAGGLGGLDLWMTTRASRNAAFGPAVNLSERINTTGNEGKPALSPDNQTLYFFSNRGAEGELWYARRASSSTAGSTIAAGTTSPVPADAVAWIDLLAEMKPNPQNSRGKWTRTPQGNLSCDREGEFPYPQLSFPARPPGSYELEFGLMFDNCSHVHVHVPAGGGVVTLIVMRDMDMVAWQTEGSFNPRNDPPVHRIGVKLQQGTEYLIRVRVQVDGPRAQVSGSINDQPLPALETEDVAQWVGAGPPTFVKATGSLGEMRRTFGINVGIGYTATLTRFRYRPIANTTPAASNDAAGPAANGEEWTDLFNGRDLTGWSIHKSEGAQPPIPWTADAERQVLVANSGGQNWLETDRTYRDFVLTLDWRFPPGKFVGPNGSGIVVRAEGLNSINYDPKGIEIDLRRTTNEQKTVGPACFITYDTPLQHQSGVAPASGNGHFGTIAEPQVFAVTNWNTCEITCQGDRISVAMNGVLVNEATGVPQRAGKICLRSQNADVEFRNIRIRKLDAGTAATGDPAGAPELVSLSELNTAEHESVPWVSTNGLRIYWEGPPPTGQEGQWIWTADRPIGSAKFENKRALFAGHHPVLTGDELEVIFTRPLGMGRFEMYSASRQSTSDPFGAPLRLPQFDSTKALNVPWLSADGLRLYVTHAPGNANTQYLISRRPDRTANWGPTEPVDIRWDQTQRGAPLQWISLSGDELSLLATHAGDAGQSRIVRSSRSSVTDPFRDWEYVSLPGIGPVHGATPRYCPQTRELFLWAPPDYSQASQADAWKGSSDVWVIRNVDLPWSGGR